MEAWKRNLVFLWVSQVLAISGFGFATPFLPFYIQELGVTEPDSINLWAGLLTSGPAIGTGIMAPIWGWLADRHGKKLMILRSTGAGAAVFALLSVAGSVQMAYALRILQGFFTGVVASAAALVASATPEEKQASALGFLSSSTFVGASLGPAVGGIAAEIVGMRNSFLIGSGLLLLGFVAVLVFVTENKNLTTGVKGVSSKARRPYSGLLSPAFIIPFVLLFLIECARLMPMPFVALHIQDITGSLRGAPARVGLIQGGRGAATAIAGLTLARLGDRYNKLRLILLYLVAAVGLAVPLYWSGSVASFAVLFIATTFFMGGVPPLIQAGVSTNVSADKRGLLFGLQSTIIAVAWFMSPMIGSAVSIAFNVRAVFLTFAVLIAASVVPVAVGLILRVGFGTVRRAPQDALQDVANRADPGPSDPKDR